MANTANHKLRGLAVTLFVLCSFAVSEPAGAQDATQTCLYDPEITTDTEPASTDGVEAGGYIWRASFQDQSVIAHDPETLEVEITKSLGASQALIVTPLTAVNELVAVPISGRGSGAVQFLDASSGEPVALIPVGADEDGGQLILVAPPAVMDEKIYVAAGDEITIIDVPTLTSGEAADNPESAVIERIPIDRTISNIDAVDDQIVYRELFTNRAFALTDSGLERFDDADFAWLNVRTKDALFEVIDGDLFRTASPAAEASEFEPTPSAVLVPVPGQVTALEVVGETVFVASYDGVGSTVWILSPTSVNLVAFVNVEDKVHRLWTASDSLFVETREVATSVPLNGCTSE